MFRSPDRIMRGLVRSKFLLTTKADQTWEGVLLEVDDNCLVLAEAALVEHDGSKTPADGQVLLPRRDVAYMQRT